ncbi:polysaccharide export protein [Roseomonas sp. SSH11]|uniref:Polysaccharide export protein n=1 Tax=Pararoseomonas baculiformis TaxID=2820812 RepID=A0ABS4ADQ2_9PROT|nr:XrtA/PEP-CTERM system exopolysaccharide export protein [Pararoseomonas baculiformis]MBP0445140.1 polysaccharide export protein [Pararoseomonas baculiformis]
MSVRYPLPDRKQLTISYFGRACSSRWVYSVATLALVLVTGCAPSVPPPVSVQATNTAGAQAPDYIIGPGDMLGIFVYRAPELSTEIPVRPDGRVSTPLVPDIVAAGRTPTQLATAIEERLRKYVLEPNVTVMVRNGIGQSTRMVRVIGEAAQPLAVPYREGMTLLDVMIGARGLTRYAAGNRAQLIRREMDGTQRIIPVRLASLLRDGDIGQDMPMQPGDTLVIPQGWF